MYTGEIENGQMHGRGTLVYPNREKYGGEWVFGKRHGNGQYTYSDGSKYEGEYQDGLKHGQGTRTSPDGVRYEEEWRAGKRAALDVAEEEDEEGGEELTKAAIVRRAAVLLACGAGLVATFADPMVGAIDGFSAAAGINPFVVAFVVTPFASNASEVVSSFQFALKKRKRNISLTYSQIYGAITMNNTLCLGLFLGIVYQRGLTWDFSADFAHRKPMLSAEESAVFPMRVAAVTRWLNEPSAESRYEPPRSTRCPDDFEM